MKMGVTAWVTFLDCCRIVTSNGGIMQSLGTLRAQVTERVSPGISFLPLPPRHYSAGCLLKEIKIKGNTYAQ